MFETNDKSVWMLSLAQFEFSLLADSQFFMRPNSFINLSVCQAVHDYWAESIKTCILDVAAIGGCQRGVLKRVASPCPPNNKIMQPRVPFFFVILFDSACLIKLLRGPFLLITISGESSRQKKITLVLERWSKFGKVEIHITVIHESVFVRCFKKIYISSWVK